MLTVYPTNEQLLWRLVPARISNEDAWILAGSLLPPVAVNPGADEHPRAHPQFIPLVNAIIAAGEHDNPSFIAMVGDERVAAPAVAVVGVLRDVGAGRENPSRWPGSYRSRHLGVLHRRVVRDDARRPQVQYWGNLDDHFSIALSFRTADPALDHVLLQESERLVDDLTMGATRAGAAS